MVTLFTHRTGLDLMFVFYSERSVFIVRNFAVGIFGALVESFIVMGNKRYFAGKL